MTDSLVVERVSDSDTFNDASINVMGRVQLVNWSFAGCDLTLHYAAC